MLIQLSKSNDRQEKGDALMALTFLHLQAPELSISKERWRELHQEALRNPHITAALFRARIYSYGEFAPKNIEQVTSDLSLAGGLEGQYRSSDGRFEFDPGNYMMVHKYTMNDLLRNEPNLPNRRMYDAMAGLVKQIEDAQVQYARQFPSTRIGKMAKDINKINQESINYGTEIIKKSQGGNQLVGQLASLESLKSRQEGDKPIFVASNPELEAATLKMMSMVGTLDAEQKKILIAAQERRYVAQGLTFQAQLEVFNQMMQGFGRGGLAGAAAPMEAVKQFDFAMIQSCAITAKWEQAMRAKDVPQVDKKKPASEIGALANKYQND